MIISKLIYKISIYNKIILSIKKRLAIHNQKSLDIFPKFFEKRFLNKFNLLHELIF